MANTDRIYLAIDLKSFYASVECVERGLDPLTTNLVVADSSRTEKTICLAVSPSLKAYGISGRARLFEVVQKVRQINAERLMKAPHRRFTGASANDPEVRANPALALDYIVATPRMSHYIRFSTRVYQVYLNFFAPEDMHTYSIDEVFIDVTTYLKACQMTPRELTQAVLRDIWKETGIIATAGIGTNLYLCKIAMDIVAKHIDADQDGMRIAELDEMSYRRMLWTHTPLTDFWRVGKGTARKLMSYGMYTMGDVARCSEQNEDLLYRLFGVNAELLIDHAWGWEPCTIAEIKAYKPDNNSFSSGQVLMEPYPYAKARVVTREMAEAAALDLLAKGMVTDQVVLTVGYDRESLTQPGIHYTGEVVKDYYGRLIPKHAHGTSHLAHYTASAGAIVNAALEIFDKTVDPTLLVRRITLDVNHVKPESELKKGQTREVSFRQLSIFDLDPSFQQEKEKEMEREDKERNMNLAVLEIKRKFGKNAIIKGINLEEGATGRQRNEQIGGHKSGA